VFTVRIDSVPGAGSLVSAAASSDKITASVVDGAGTGGDALMVLPGEVRIRNTSTARASYQFTLPRSVTRLRIVIADRVMFDGPPTATVSLIQPH
jgi:hypothetical protein